MYHTHDEHIFLTIRLRDIICCQGVCRVSEKACWLFEADLGEGLRGYVPRSSYVSMARLRECTESQIPQNSRPDCGGWARLPLSGSSGPWRREGMPHYCHRNEAQPVITTNYCMSNARRVVRPGLPCVFLRPYRPSGLFVKV